MIVPFFIISLLLKNMGNYKLTKSLYLETIGFTLLVGFTYLAAMNGGLVSDYGLGNDSVMWFSISYILLILTLPILLEWR